MSRHDGNYFPGNPLTGNPAIQSPPTGCPECGRKLRLVGHSFSGRYWPSLICRGWLSPLFGWLPYPWEDGLSHYIFRLPLDAVPDRYDRHTGRRLT